MFLSKIYDFLTKAVIIKAVIVKIFNKLYNVGEFTRFFVYFLGKHAGVLWVFMLIAVK